MGGTTTTSNQSNSPYAPAQPGINALIGQIKAANPTTTLTPAQTSALGTLSSEAGSMPNMGNAAAPTVEGLLSGQPASQGLGIWGNAYNTLGGDLAPYLSPNFTNPLSNPTMQSALQWMNEQARNSINGTFDAAGRTGGASPSGSGPSNAAANANLARAISQGDSSVLTNEYNTLTNEQLGAASSLFGAGSAYGNAATQLPIASMTAGLQGASMIPGLWTAPGAAQLQTADTAVGLPYQNLQPAFSDLTSIGSAFPSAAMSTYSPFNYGALGAGAGLGLLSLGTGGGNTIGGSLFNGGSLFSDERLKEDIEPIGILHNGLPIYRFKYIGDPTETTRVGLMAQDVEEVNPNAVTETSDLGIMGPSWKMVNYDLATR